MKIHLKYLKEINDQLHGPLVNSSISVEQDWVCEKAWIPALSQSLFFGGAIPGMIFFGWFADSYGRIPATVLSNLVCLVTGVVTPFVTGKIDIDI